MCLLNNFKNFSVIFGNKEDILQHMAVTIPLAGVAWMWLSVIQDY